MVCFFLMSLGLFADVDPKVIEASANEAVGPVGNVEYKQLVEKLGGTRKNQVFSSFGIVPPRREAEALLAEAQEKKQQKATGGVGTTIVLEKKKQRGGAAGAGAAKRPKVLESLLGMAPLQSKGDSEDDAGE